MKLLALWDFPLFPESASTMAPRVDLIYLGLVLMSGAISIFIFGLLAFFAVKYRAGSGADRSNPITQTAKYELVWVGVPLVIALTLFFFAARVYFSMQRPPEDAMDIYVVARQWMWKVQHPDGRREINTLHVPVGRPVKVLMTSQDVIHDLYIPAFRVKMDVLPGKLTWIWFHATRTGEYHLFCAEYCGADHSRMIGKVVVMEPADYQRWLAEGSLDIAAGSAGGDPLSALGCSQCHVPNSDVRAPRLEGLFGRQVKLQSGEVVIADEEYIRRSIVDPQAQIVAGYAPLMPSFKTISPERLMELIQYIKALDGQGAREGDTP